MNIWHLTHDTPRTPYRVSPGERVAVDVGTWPMEPGQAVEVQYWVEHPNRTTVTGRAEAAWQHNTDSNSYWRAEFGPFARGDRVAYCASRFTRALRIPHSRAATFSLGCDYTRSATTIRWRRWWPNTLTST